MDPIPDRDKYFGHDGTGRARFNDRQPVHVFPSHTKLMTLHSFSSDENITPVYRVIDRAWIFDPNLASHKAKDGFRSALVKIKSSQAGNRSPDVP